MSFLRISWLKRGASNITTYGGKFLCSTYMSCRLSSSYDVGFLTMIAGKKAPSLRVRMEETRESFRQKSPIQSGSMVDVRGNPQLAHLISLEFQGEGKVRNDSAISELQWCGIPAADIWTLQLIYCIFICTAVSIHRCWYRRAVCDRHSSIRLDRQFDG